MLQLSVFALGYQGLIFSWVLLVLRLLAGCCYSCRLKTSYLCHVLALLEGMERAVYLTVHTCNLPSWLYLPDTERVEWISMIISK